MRVLDALEPNNLRPLFGAYDDVHDIAHSLHEDLGFARALIGAFGPARHRPPPQVVPVFGAPRPFAIPHLATKRIAVLASGGSGATASVVGVRRAFEEAGIEPVLISA